MMVRAITYVYLNARETLHSLAAQKQLQLGIQCFAPLYTSEFARARDMANRAQKRGPQYALRCGPEGTAAGDGIGGCCR